MAQDFHTEMLSHTHVACVGDCHCHEPAGNSYEKEHSTGYEFILPRRGVFEIFRGRSQAVADPNNLVFYNAGDEYRVNHPGECGDTSTIIWFNKETLEELMDEAGLPVPTGETLLPHRAMPLDRAMVLAHHSLLQLVRQKNVNPLAAEEALIIFVAAVFERLLEQQGKVGRLNDPVPLASVDSVKSLLAAEPERNHTLEEISKRIGYSRYHLCRLFRSEAGMSIYRYLLELRIRVAMDHIAEGADDLTALALELGFSSHSHFSYIFRSLTGTTPSAFRKRGITVHAEELRTILKA